ncbi:MAG: hypothetical protein WBW93_08975 [Steroidobacteraceae bacterium]
MIRAFIIGILSASAIAACSTTPSHPSRTASTLSPGRCSTAAGQAIPRGGCTSEVRSYSNEQLQETGKTDAAHALQMLDPAVTVHGP